MQVTPSGLKESGLLSVGAAGPRGLTADDGNARRQEFDRILRQSLPRFRRIAMRVLRNAEDAEDAVQEAMLSAHRYIAQFDGRSQMSTWVTSIVINAVRMQLRRRSRRITISLEQDPKEGQWAVDEWPVDPGPNPEQILQHRELWALAVRLVARLPRAQREALHLRQKDGLSIKQAAEALGVPQGTLKARLARARAELARRFRKIGHVDRTRMARSDSKAGSAVNFAGCGKDRAKQLPDVSFAVLDPQAGCENWIGA